MSSQRYVSADLTHFVGRKRKTLAEQYHVLKRILTEGRLRGPKKMKGQRYSLDIDPSGRLSENAPYLGPFVCFCDIPIADLGIHISKYSPFGLAFSKAFLLGRGATPVMYVPRDGRPALLPFNPYPRGRVSSNTAAFDQFWVKYRKIREDVEKGKSERDKSLQDVVDFLDAFVLSHIKFFDARTPDEAEGNFYMEREWRVSAEVEFELNDVRRVIIPKAYAPKFRRAFRDYTGELVFASRRY